MKVLTSIAAAILLTSCALYNTRFTDVQVGMDRSQVTELLGKPVSKEGQGNQEVLHYRLASSILDTDGSDTPRILGEASRRVRRA